MTMRMPENEAERLEALRSLEILDTPPEENFDELTALASYICQVPIAIISLVDETRQWFKSKIGMSLCATPREISFCTHTILQSDLFVVADALWDERFADNPLVTSAPGIRFYAGAPLVTQEGHALGALCVIDHQPRELTAEQCGALRTLSHVVVTQLRLRRDILERQRAEAELRQVTARRSGSGRTTCRAASSRTVAAMGLTCGSSSATTDPNPRRESRIGPTAYIPKTGSI
jgi:GAF domain-containing protein